MTTAEDDCSSYMKKYIMYLKINVFCLVKNNLKKRKIMFNIS